MISVGLAKKITIGLLAVFLSVFLLGPGSSEASVLRPGIGKKPQTPTTWQKPSEHNNKNDNKQDNATEERATWKKPQKNDDFIRVGLASGVVQATISSVTGMHILGEANKRDYGDFRSNVAAVLTVSDNVIAVNGKKSSSTSLVFVPISRESGTIIRYNGTDYRGEIVAKVIGDKLVIVNLISVEDYIKGVLPSEMSPSWNKEALKAQAVAARTYAIYTKNQKVHLGDGYDLCNATHCQAYDGLSGEVTAASEAVDATKGQIMTYQGVPIYAPYHASSGGVTENSEDVWGNKLPYLRSVKDDDSKSPYHSWSVKFTAAQVQKLLSSAGKNIGQLKNIALASPNGGASGTLSSGRIAGVRFEGTGQTITLSSQQVRQIFGLKSSYFTVRTQRRTAAVPTAKPNSNVKSNKTDVIDTPPAAMKDKELHVENGNVEIIFDGHGFGHGLGMAQYGAKAMADAGKKYDDILHHYYTDVEISKKD